MCGSAIIFESVLKRTVWHDKYELTYVAPSQLSIKAIHDPKSSIIVESQLGLEIDDVRLMGLKNTI